MFLETKKPGKKIQEIHKVLGEAYSIQVIDRENVIYRDLGNGYDIEVSNLDNQKKEFNATLYIWDNRISHIVETLSGVHSIEELKSALDKSVEKYLSANNI